MFVRSAPSSHYMLLFSMATPWTWARCAASTLALARASIATSSPTTTRATASARASPPRRTSTLTSMPHGRHCAPKVRRITVLQSVEQKLHSQKDRQDEKAEGYVPDEGTR